MHGKLSMFGVIAVLAAGVALVASVSHAQYPSPGGAVEVQAGSTTADPGDNVPVTCVAEDDDGTPIASIPCDFAIVGEPEGSDSAFGSKAVTKLTNSQGMATATLYVGTVPGVLIVEVEANGMTSSVLITVTGETASPPQSPIGGITPPSTGSGGLVN